MAQGKVTIDPTQWGAAQLREDKSSKGEGFFGNLLRPDSTESQPNVMSEYSVGVPINGKEMDIPTFVPTLTAPEVEYLLNIKEGEKLPQSIISKAASFAKQRIAAGLPVWAQHGEQQNDVYPQFQRAQVKMPTIMSRTGQPTNPNAIADLLLQRKMGTQ